MLIPQEAIILETADSKVVYEAGFVDLDEVSRLFDYLFQSINWQSDTATIYGKTFVTKRQIAWMAEPGLNYNYSGSNRIADGIWDAEVYKIKQNLEAHTGYKFNSCLLNLYPTGGEGMAFHSDDQNHLEPNCAVVIVSLGAERYLKFRPNPKLEHSSNLLPCRVLLEQGSLVSMEGQTQKYWQHEIPKMAAIKNPRISLTFRQMITKGKK